MVTRSQRMRSRESVGASPGSCSGRVGIASSVCGRVSVSAATAAAPAAEIGAAARRTAPGSILRIGGGGFSDSTPSPACRRE